MPACLVSPEILSPWLASDDLLAVFSHAFSLCTHIPVFFLRTQALLDYSPTFLTPFNVKFLLKGSVSKDSHIGDLVSTQKVDLGKNTIHPVINLLQSSSISGNGTTIDQLPRPKP